LNRASLAVLAALVALAAIVAGCGSDDDSDTTASLTKTEFIKQADAICAKSEKQVSTEFEDFAKENDIPLDKEPSEEQSEELVEEVLIPSVQDQADGIRDLGLPSGDEDRVEAMLDALDEAIEEAEDDPAALFASGSDPFAKANKLASDYGLEVCGQS
jgi:hypothetical protein